MAHPTPHRGSGRVDSRPAPGLSPRIRPSGFDPAPCAFRAAAMASHPPLRSVRRQLILATALASLAWACNLGGGKAAGTSGGPVGSEADKPGGGGTFFVDPNQGGGASRLRLVEMFWGRLVDAHPLLKTERVDAAGNVIPGSEVITEDSQPRFRNIVINENIQSDLNNYDLLTNPVTQRSRLVIQAVVRVIVQDSAGNFLREEIDAAGKASFDLLLQAATANLPPITPRDDGALGGTPSFMSRNGCLVARFDDLLDDSIDAAQSLGQTVRVLTGYAPTTPFSARLLFDQSYGGIAGNAYHTTRLLLDMTVSETEAVDANLPINSLGLPASQPPTVTTAPNVSMRIPTRTDFGSGQCRLFTNVNGAPLATTGNGPIDFEVPTVDVVRGMRSGNGQDLNHGFLLDRILPELIGGWPLSVDSSVQNPAGQPGFDFIV